MGYPGSATGGSGEFLRDCLAHGFLICCNVKNGVNAGEDLQRRAAFAEHVGSCPYPQGGT
jgi:hypothetical protein